MDKQVNTVREYSFADFGKVLLSVWKRALIWMLVVGIVFGASLGCIAIFVTHSEYTASIVKVDDKTYNVPIVESMFREHIRNAVRKIYVEEKGQPLNENQLNTLAREVNSNLSVESDEANGSYEFTLTSFKSSIFKFSDGDIEHILEGFVNEYKMAYANKINAKYVLPTSTMTEAIFTEIETQHYYHQAETLKEFIVSLKTSITNSTYDSIIDDGKAVLVPSVLSNKIAPVLNDLDNILNTDIPTAQGFISNNSVVKSGLNYDMEDYVEGQIQLGNDSKWALLAPKFEKSEVLANANASNQTKADGLITDIKTKIENALDEYNRIAADHAEEKTNDYVLFSFIDANENVGAMPMIVVILITAAAMGVAFVLCYFLRFSKMQRAGEIGTVLVEEPDEE